MKSEIILGIVSKWKRGLYQREQHLYRTLFSFLFTFFSLRSIFLFKEIIVFNSSSWGCYWEMEIIPHLKQYALLCSVNNWNIPIKSSAWMSLWPTYSWQPYVTLSRPVSLKSLPVRKEIPSWSDMTFNQVIVFCDFISTR